VLGLDELFEKMGENNSIKAVAAPYRERTFEKIKEDCAVCGGGRGVVWSRKTRAIEIQEAGNC
jgi:hypothetical protein